MQLFPLSHQARGVIKVTGFGASASMDDYTTGILNSSTTRQAQLVKFGHRESLPPEVEMGGFM